MPGVPSYTGCEACRRQKKKCDYVCDSCSRCSRLRIRCVGGGQRRYKFKNRDPDSIASWLERHNDTRAMTLSAPLQTDLSSSLAKLTSMLLTKDVRFDVSCYGVFLDDIPRRLGHSVALDEAVNALVASYPTIHARQQPQDALGRYVSALAATKACLQDPIEVRRVDTLCAIYILLICQVSMEPQFVFLLLVTNGIKTWHSMAQQNSAAHIEGIAAILSLGAFEHWQDPFEMYVLVTLCIPVVSNPVRPIFESAKVEKIATSIINRQISLNPWLDKLVETCQRSLRTICQNNGTEHPTGATVAHMLPMEPVYTLRLPNLSKLQGFLHEPRTNAREIMLAYDYALFDIDAMKQQLDMLLSNHSPRRNNSGPTSSGSAAYRNHATLYGVVLGLGLLYNQLAQITHFDNSELLQRAICMQTEIANVAEQVLKYRPLGTGYFLAGLISAWAAAADDCTQRNLERIIAAFVNDRNTEWKQTAVWLRNRYGRLRERRDSLSIGHIESDIDENDGTGLRQSCFIQ